MQELVAPAALGKLVRSAEIRGRPLYLLLVLVALGATVQVVQVVQVAQVESLFAFFIVAQLRSVRRVALWDQRATAEQVVKEDKVPPATPVPTAPPVFRVSHRQSSQFHSVRTCRRVSNRRKCGR
jgi:hypothetical protein